MQAGAINGRVYDNMLHALLTILEKGLAGLYRQLGPSRIKIVPAAGILFMCYEACKKILVEKEDMNHKDWDPEGKSRLDGEKDFTCYDVYDQEAN
nr:hypothetical protein [Tanacetum cinerariifolium]